MYKKSFATASLILLLSLSLLSAVPVNVSGAVSGGSMELFAQGPKGLFGMAFDSKGNLYVAHEGYIDDPDVPGTSILKITPTGKVTIFATGFKGPAGLAFDKNGNLWVSDDTHGAQGYNIWKITPRGDVVPGSTFIFGNPNAIAFDKDGNLFVAAAGGDIWKIAPDGTVTWIAGGFACPESVDTDDSGNIYTSDMSGKVYKINASGTVSVFAAGLGGTNGGLVLDGRGNVYASFEQNVLVLTPNAVRNVYVTGFTSDPRGLVFDNQGRLYITDCDAGLIWRYTPPEIAFDSYVAGECMIAYGGLKPGQGFPDPMTWSGLGGGEATMTGIAGNVIRDYWFGSERFPYSNQIQATGSISINWNEGDVTHGLQATISATQGTEGVFISCEDVFTLPIPGYSMPETTLLEASVTNTSGSETTTFNGGALFSSGIWGGRPFGAGTIVILIDPGPDDVYLTEDDTMCIIMWSPIATPTPDGSPLAAADVYKSSVETREMTDPDALPGGRMTQANGINDQGVVVGSSTIPTTGSALAAHAFLWTEDGEVVDLGTLPLGPETNRTSRAVDVNSKGQVVGSSNFTIGTTGPITSHAFLWTGKGGMVDLGTPQGYGNSEVRDINNLGYIVGSSWNTNLDRHACLWTSSGQVIDLGTLGGSSSSATGINDDNQVVGAYVNSAGQPRAFLWTMKTGMVDIGTLGGPASVARGINNLGMVVGSSATSSGEQHAFLWTNKRGMIDLGTLGGNMSCAESINDYGQIVGYSNTTMGPAPAPIHACMWTEDGQIIDLHPTFPSIYPYSTATRINNKGQIVGFWKPAFFQFYGGIWTVSS